MHFCGVLKEELVLSALAFSDEGRRCLHFPFSVPFHNICSPWTGLIWIDWNCSILLRVKDFFHVPYNNVKMIIVVVVLRFPSIYLEMGREAKKDLLL